MVMEQIAFNHRIFVVSLMNIDYHYDSSAVFCDNTFLSRHGDTCMQPGVGRSEIHPAANVLFLTATSSSTVCFERDF